MTWKCLLDGGLGLNGRRNLFSSVSVFSSYRLLGSNWEFLFNKEGTMFNIKRAFLNKGQTENGKKGDLVGKERGVAAVDSTRVGKG